MVGTIFPRFGYRFNVEWFEVWLPGLSSKSKGSRFGRVCSIQDRRVRGLVAWAFLKSKGSKFKRVCSLQGRRARGFVAWAVFKAEGFRVWARVFVSKSKGSRFGRLVIF